MNRQPASRPTICVVIPHLNQERDLAFCLASISAGRRPPDEVIVVDNGSARLPHDICAAHPNVHLLHQPLRGPGLARNMGALHSSSDVLAFIDADCRAGPEWLAEAERALRQTPDVILGGEVCIAPRDPAKLTAIEAYESIFAYRMDRYIARAGFTGTGNLVVRRDIFVKIGPFKGIAVAEDREWGQRATAMGRQMAFVPEMIVFHPARTSFAALRLKWDRQLAHDMAARTGLKARSRWAAKSFALVLSPLTDLPRIMFSDRLDQPSDKDAAFRILMLIRAHRGLRMIQLLCGMNPDRLLQRWNLNDAN